jgi:hypothetical protein
MTGRPVTALAAEAARTVRRRLRAARGRGAPRMRGHIHDLALPGPVQAPPEQSPPEQPLQDQAADDAELDALRGQLVRELDRLAAADQDCSASFRRV